MSVDLYVFQPLGTNSGRAYLALLEKGVDFVEHELVGPEFEHLRPEYLAINPRGQVPTIVHDGKVITEGTALCEYVDEAFDGPPLRPADLRERWKMRMWCRFIDNDLGRCLMMINWNKIIPVFVGAHTREDMERVIERVPDPARREAWRNAYLQTTPPDQIAESRRRLAVAAQRIEATLARQPYLAGDTYSFADIDLITFYSFFPGERWFPELVNETAAPATIAWFARMEERPAVRKMRAQSHPPVVRERAAAGATA